MESVVSELSRSIKADNLSPSELFEDVLQGLEGLGALADEILLVRVKFENAGTLFLESFLTQSRLKEMRANLVPHMLSENLISLLDLADEWTRQGSSNGNIRPAVCSDSVRSIGIGDTDLEISTYALGDNLCSGDCPSAGTKVTARKRKAQDSLDALAPSSKLESKSCGSKSPFGRTEPRWLFPPGVELCGSEELPPNDADSSPVRTKGLPSSSREPLAEMRDSAGVCPADSRVKVATAAASTSRRGKTNKRIGKLQTGIANLQQRIRAIDEQEISLSDLEEDHSLLEKQEQLKKKVVSRYKQLCDLTGSEHRSGVPKPEVNLNFTEIRQPALNAALKQFVQSLPSRKNFPNVNDFYGILVQARNANKLAVSDLELLTFSRQVLSEVGDSLQAYRRSQYWQLHGSPLTDEAFRAGNILKPLPIDEDLKKRLQQNKKARLESLRRLDSQIEKDTLGIRDHLLVSSPPSKETSSLTANRNKEPAQKQKNGNGSAESKQVISWSANSHEYNSTASESSLVAHDLEVSSLLKKSIFQEESKQSKENENEVNSVQTAAIGSFVRPCVVRVKKESSLGFSEGDVPSMASSHDDSIACRDTSQQRGPLAKGSCGSSQMIKTKMRRLVLHPVSAMTACRTSVEKKQVLDRFPSSPSEEVEPKKPATGPAKSTKDIEVIVID